MNKVSKNVLKLLLISLMIMTIPGIRKNVTAEPSLVCAGTTAGGTYNYQKGQETSQDYDGGLNILLDDTETITFTAKANTGYVFVGWYEGVIGQSSFVEDNNGILLEASASITISESKNIQAVFKPIYKVVVEIPSAGYDKQSPNVKEEEDRVTLSHSGFHLSASEAIKTRDYFAGTSTEYGAVYTGMMEAGTTYYAVAGVEFNEDETADVARVQIKENENVSQVGQPVKSQRGDENVVYVVFAVTIPSITVTVEFGKGHETFARTVAALFEYGNPTVNGSTVQYKAQKGTDLWFGVAKPIRDALFDQSLSRIDAGEMINILETNLKPLNKYSSNADFMEDYESYQDYGPREEDITLFVQWLKPTNVEIKVEPLLCGTTVINPDPQDMEKEWTVPKISIISGEAELYEESPVYWMTSTREWITEPVRGGVEYVVYLAEALFPKFGYFVNELTANGTVESPNPYAHLVSIEAEHDFADWEVTNPANENEPGTETSTCNACKEASGERNFVYRVIKGENSSWEKGRSSGLEFIFERSVGDENTFPAFEGDHVGVLYLDGDKNKTIAYSIEAGQDATISEGSLRVMLNPKYLETLSIGKHTITAEFVDGVKTANFTIKEKSSGGSEASDTAPKKYALPKTGIE